MAVELELRYRGLRSPHKLKMGVSGCARECAEARGKDVGVIATDKGWNLYVGGNGGFRPRGTRSCSPRTSTPRRCVRTIDRFLMYYVRTADRLQRTAPWIEEVDGGLEGVREVILEDSLGICADLDAAMARHVDELRGRVEGRARGPGEAAPVLVVRQRPRGRRTRRSRTSPERGQRRPATAEERTSGVVIAGPKLEVRA